MCPWSFGLSPSSYKATRFNYDISTLVTYPINYPQEVPPPNTVAGLSFHLLNTSLQELNLNTKTLGSYSKHTNHSSQSP